MVWSDDGDEIHALPERQRGFGFHHLLKRTVAARGGKIEVGPRITRTLRVAAESSADEFDAAVHGGGDAVNGSDKGATASTDHSHADFAFGCRRVH